MFLPAEIIAKKRDGKSLKPAEINAFVEGIVSGTVKPEQAAAFVMAVYFQNMDIDERVALTLAMRDSGEVLSWDELDGPVIDKHSTGGVGDNVSLMLAPMWAACGAFVPMISGRGLGHTGGTLDKFDAIPGYQTSVDNAHFRKVVREAGCAIVGQTNDLAPADKILYAIRDVTATVDNISLITGSILSKKLAAGLDALVLDVKVGSGAFMKSVDEAKELAESLVFVANGAGVNTSALITDMNQPLASTAGNALEVQNAVDFLSGRHRDPRLEQVVIELAAHGLVHGKLVKDVEEGREQARHVLDSGKAAEQFGKMITGLGGPSDFMQNCAAHLPKADIIRDVFADQAGFVTEIDAKQVGMGVVVLGGGRKAPGDMLDYAVGFDRLAPIGEKIEKGAPIARLHANDTALADEATARLKAAYTIGNAPQTPELFFGVIEQT
ncbi:pyrimidine-nucleoside phosphorylase [Maritalea myrionectae]|uniref:Thymidine phosphorylase n=1 Tax=Maritalea myrionectae TaxID=454601 RepID=A0A2R4MHW9_9HYPH|nr:thymidine phosphorylase [Maritalea myrionectae]AVX05625.1 pyrimidine-nucleoside phosphorylase [Maritalea myrionectae]